MSITTEESCDLAEGVLSYIESRCGTVGEVATVIEVMLATSFVNQADSVKDAIRLRDLFIDSMIELRQDFEKFAVREIKVKE